MTQKKNMKHFLLLGSTVALGVYVPALTVKKQLESRGYQADLFTMEELYTGKESVMEETKKHFHEDFRLAKFSYRIPTRNRTVIDPEKKEQFLETLRKKPYDTIITFSGFWAEILKELRERCPEMRGHLYAIHMDAGKSHSWDGVSREDLRNLWLYRLEEQAVYCTLEKPVINNQRRKRILVHGGGWGIGEYQTYVQQLNLQGWTVDRIVYYPQEADPKDSVNTHYLLDPAWKPDAGKKEYPRLLKMEQGEWIPFEESREKRNPITVLMEQDLAVLSKPGGGTLADSLSHTVPLLFAPPLASYEADNQELWELKGFGMKAEDFLACMSKEETLAEMRHRLEEQSESLPCVLDYLETEKGQLR